MLHQILLESSTSIESAGLRGEAVADGAYLLSVDLFNIKSTPH